MCLAILVELAAELRTELLLIGVPAVGLGLVQLLGGQPILQRTAQRIGRALTSVLAGRLTTVIVIVVVLIAVERLPWPQHWRWFLAGIQPLNLSFLNLPGALGVFLPLGFVALFVLGEIHALRRWVTFGLLPITLVILYKVYLKAGHGVFFESFRYITFITPMALFLALFGFRELSDWATHWAWPSWWKRVAVALLLLSLARVGQSPGVKEFFSRRQQLPGVAESPRLVTAATIPLLGWNSQTEVRYLLDLVARYPQCVFLTKGTQADAVAFDGPGYRWAVFGAPVPNYREQPYAGERLEQAAAAMVPDASCVLFYRSADCDLVESDACQPETQGRTALEERRLENLPYSDIREYGAHRPEIRLAVYPVVGQS